MHMGNGREDDRFPPEPKPFLNHATTPSKISGSSQPLDIPRNDSENSSRGSSPMLDPSTQNSIMVIHIFLSNFI